MLEFLYHLSDLAIFFLLIIMTIAISLFSIILSKRLILTRLRYRDNATIASISSLIGIIYGVLVGFIALYLIDNNDHASDAVLREASAVANVYRESQWLKPPIPAEIHTQMEAYVATVINKEWPLMRDGSDAEEEGDFIIQRVSSLLRNYPIVTETDKIIVQDLLGELKALYNSRHERISLSRAQLSPELWEVVLVGTILIIGINYAFRVNFFLHLFGISAFAIMAASMLFLLVTLDRPFRGEFAIQPDAFWAVQRFMKTGDDSQIKPAAKANLKHRHIQSFHKDWSNPLGQASI